MDIASVLIFSGYGPVRITICNLGQKSQIKYLGVFIDEHLKWDAQLQHINNKLT